MTCGAGHVVAAISRSARQRTDVQWLSDVTRHASLARTIRVCVRACVCDCVDKCAVAGFNRDTVSRPTARRCCTAAPLDTRAVRVSLRDHAATAGRVDLRPAALGNRRDWTTADGQVPSHHG